MICYEMLYEMSTPLGKPENTEDSDQTARIKVLYCTVPQKFPWPKDMITQLAFYVNLHRAVIGPSATLTG